MVRGLGWALRVAAVFTGAAVLLLAGKALLRANAQVRPMWQGPNAVAMAQTQLTRAQAAVATAQQDVTQLQAQTQQLGTSANSLAQLLTQVGVQNGGTAVGGGNGGAVQFGRDRRDRRFGGDDGGNF